jgi:hypothetical protein
MEGSHGCSLAEQAALCLLLIILRASNMFDTSPLNPFLISA